MESGAETTITPKFVTADSCGQRCPKAHSPFPASETPGSCPACYFPSLFFSFSPVLWAALDSSNHLLLYKLPGVCIFCLNQRSLHATVDISLCPRRRVRGAISQFQRVSPATTAARLLKRWDSKEQGGRSEQGRVAGCVNTGVFAEGLPSGGCGSRLASFLGLCCKPGRGDVVVWDGLVWMPGNLTLV